MAKTLVVGDIHLKASSILEKVDDVLECEGDIDEVVFLGDICDEWDADDDTFMREIEEFVDWVEDQRADGLQVEVLYGNHDFQYLLGEYGPGTHMNLLGFVGSTLFQLEPKIACEVDGFLLTHAGLTQTYADEYLNDPTDAEEAATQLNDILAENTYPALKVLSTCGEGRGGDEIAGPLWADKWELEEDPIDGIPQIVGHTPVSTAYRGEAELFNPDAPTIWFCDTHSLQSDMVPIGDGSMLLVEDGSVRVV